MSDLFGFESARAPFKDIANQRPSVAEEKAILAKQLNELVKVVPQSVRSGSIQRTRNWMAAQKSALKILNNKRSSVQELQSAISSMSGWSA